MNVSSTSLTNSSNATGRFDKSEFMQKMFDRIDGDGDGKITQDEFATSVENRFKAGMT